MKLEDIIKSLTIGVSNDGKLVIQKIGGNEEAFALNKKLSLELAMGVLTCTDEDILIQSIDCCDTSCGEVIH